MNSLQIILVRVNDIFRFFLRWQLEDVRFSTVIKCGFYPLTTRAIMATIHDYKA